MQSTNLNFTRQGDGPPVLIVHGLFGSLKNWQSLAKALATEFSVISVDLRNHGDSPHSPDMSFAAMAQDIIDLVERLGLDRISLIGHSMGGKIVMKISHMTPTLIARQIVADIAPVAYSHGYDHVFEPVLKLNLDLLKKRSEADRELAKDVPDPALRAFLLQSLSSSADGLSWKLNWPVLHQYIDEIIGYESIDDWRIDVPTLFLSGALSNYVDDDARGLIRQHFTVASFQSLKNAGHWLHADQPRAFYQAAYDYLSGD